MAKRDDYDSDAPETVVGATVKIEGDLISEGDIKVDGFVTGKIKTSKNLYVGPNAKIEAQVEAGSAVVAGAIKGDIKVNSNLFIQESGKIEGNVTVARLEIAPGAYFSGTCTMPEAQMEFAEPLPEE